MGTSLSHWLWSWATAFQAPENILRYCKISMFGFEGAGKTTLLCRYLTGTVLKEPAPTIGFSMESFKVPESSTSKALNISLFEVGGGPDTQRLWRHFYFGIHGIIFVIDSGKQQAQACAEVKSLFANVNAEKDLDRLPILIFLNKYERAEQLACVEAVKAICAGIHNRPVFVMPCSALQSADELKQGFEWLFTQLSSS